MQGENPDFVKLRETRAMVAKQLNLVEADIGQAFLQCCGSGSSRIRKFFLDPDPDLFVSDPDPGKNGWVLIRVKLSCYLLLGAASWRRDPAGGGPLSSPPPPRPSPLEGSNPDRSCLIDPKNSTNLYPAKYFVTYRYLHV